MDIVFRKLEHLSNWLKRAGHEDEVSGILDLIGKASDSKLNDVIVIDHKSPPLSGDVELDKIIKDVLSNLDPSDLHKDYSKLHRSGSCNPLTGFCRITTEVFWELASRLGREEYNYKPCRVVHDGGPHYFLKDIVSNHIIDLTAGQFADDEGEHIPVPYDQGVCDTEDKRSASKNWSNRSGDSFAMPGYNLGRGARNTLERIMQSEEDEK
tara:strand:+ start:4803 stop:5432 length:630 start_codon:yes stop_codon:yes gene_type:complete